VDVDLRLLRAFLAVADELHFGRAAERLHIAQPALSQQIQRLERQLGLRLLDRTSRAVALSAAGETFLAEARRTVGAADRAVAVARRIARGERPELVVGFLAQGAAEQMAAILSDFRARQPEVVVRMRAMRFTDHLSALRTGELDLSLLRPPYGADELTEIDLVELWSERRVAVVPTDHRLAGRDAIGFDELAGETFVRVPDAVSPTWRAFWQVAERRSNGRVPRLADEVVDSVEEMLTVVAAGRAISLTHESVGRFYARPTVRYVPVTDVSPSVLALGWRADDRTPAVRDFVAAALAVVDGNTTDSDAPTDVSTDEPRSAG
jgi:DNA-binding transcriptional LysR family regulator